MRTVVRVFTGAYDVTYKGRLRTEFEAVCLEPNLVLDMRDVSYVDSTFTSELIRLHKCRLEKGIGVVSIVRNSFIVKNLFAILYFKSLFRLVNTLEEVLPADGSPIVIQCATRNRSALCQCTRPIKTDRIRSGIRAEHRRSAVDA
jgi:anti-anti-sigma regulatory factor